MRNTNSRIAAVVFTLAGILFLAVSPAGAQSYAGTNIEDGIFDAPSVIVGGSEIEFSVEGLAADSELTFTLTNLDSTQDPGNVSIAVLGAVAERVDSSGSFNGEIALPSNLAVGRYQLLVEGLRADGTVFTTELPFEITAATATQATADGDDALALTGSSTRNSLLGGLVLVGFGIGLVLFATRSQREESVEV